MTRELPQKRPGAGSVSISSYSSTASSFASMPPKKRPRRPEFDEIEPPTPLDLSAKLPATMMPPQQQGAAELQQPLAAHMSAAVMAAAGAATAGISCGGGAFPDPVYSWRAAAAAAMYAKYMTYWNSLALGQPAFLPPAPPPPPPLPPMIPAQLPHPPPPPPPPPPPLTVSHFSANSVEVSCGGETDFRCSCGRSYASLIGLTVHMQSAGHSGAASGAGTDAVTTATPATAVVKELPKLVRGQDMWINSETEQTREILRCMRCKQSYSTLPELTMHMVRSRHYAEIIYNTTADGAHGAHLPKRPRPSQQSPQPQPQPPQPQLQASASPTLMRQQLERYTSSNTQSGPAYLSPNIQPPSASARPTDALDNSPLSCLQRLVNETTAVSSAGADNIALAAAAAADAAGTPGALSPSSISCASSSSSSDLVDSARSPREPPSTPASSATSTPPLRAPLPLRRQQQQPQQHQQPQQQQQPKKTKCQHCGKPFANKGQVRLHVSKGKCPAGAAAAACFVRRMPGSRPEVCWELPLV